MNFAQTSAIYEKLLKDYHGGQINWEQFAKSVSDLQAIDEQGNYWTIRPEDGTWLMWNGHEWINPNTTFPAPETTPPSTDPQAEVLPNAPNSLFELVLSVIKSIPRSIATQMVKSIIIFALVWLFHIVIMVFLNDGWAKAGSNLLGMILVVKGGMVEGGLFWVVLFGLLTSVFRRSRKEGLSSLISEVKDVPPLIGYNLSSATGSGRVLFAGAAALALLAGFWFLATRPDYGLPYIPNRLLSLLLVFTLLLSMSSSNQGMAFLVSRLAWQDWHKLINKQPLQQFNFGITYLGLGGLAAGFALAAILPFLPIAGWAGVVILGIICLAAAGIKPSSAAPLLLFLFAGAALAILLDATPVFAHDWGWNEATGGGPVNAENIQRLIQSSGFSRAAGHSSIAGAGAVIGTILGGGSIPSVITGGGVVPAGVHPPVIPIPAESPTRILSGQDALEWLAAQGVLERGHDGGWVKKEDYDSFIRHRPDIRGFMEAGEVDESTVNENIAIILESGNTQAGPGINSSGPVVSTEAVPPEPAPGQETDAFPEEPGEEVFVLPELEPITGVETDPEPVPGIEPEPAPELEAEDVPPEPEEVEPVAEEPLPETNDPTLQTEPHNLTDVVNDFNTRAESHQAEVMIIENELANANQVIDNWPPDSDPDDLQQWQDFRDALQEDKNNHQTAAQNYTNAANHLSSADAEIAPIYTQPLPDITETINRAVEDIRFGLGKEDLPNFQPDRWSNLSDAEKEDMLCRATTIMRESLGMWDQDIEIVFCPTTPYAGGMEMSADLDMPRLTISDALRNDPEQALRTVVHEIRHWQQVEPTVSLGDAASDRVAQLNSDHYINPVQDPILYENGFLERDAYNFEDRFMEAIKPHIGG